MFLPAALTDVETNINLPDGPGCFLTAFLLTPLFLIDGLMQLSRAKNKSKLTLKNSTRLLISLSLFWHSLGI